jgi:hypothetical protein
MWLPAEQPGVLGICCWQAACSVARKDDASTSTSCSSMALRLQLLCPGHLEGFCCGWLTCVSYKNPGGSSGLTALSISRATNNSRSDPTRSRLSGRMGSRPAADRRSRYST